MDPNPLQINWNKIVEMIQQLPQDEKENNLASLTALHETIRQNISVIYTTEALLRSKFDPDDVETIELLNALQIARQRIMESIHPLIDALSIEQD